MRRIWEVNNPRSRSAICLSSHLVMRTNPSNLREHTSSQAQRPPVAQLYLLRSLISNLQLKITGTHHISARHDHPNASLSSETLGRSQAGTSPLLTSPCLPSTAFSLRTRAIVCHPSPCHVVSVDLLPLHVGGAPRLRCHPVLLEQTSLALSSPTAHAHSPTAPAHSITPGSPTLPCPRPYPHLLSCPAPACSRPHFLGPLLSHRATPRRTPPLLPNGRPPTDSGRTDIWPPGLLLYAPCTFVPIPFFITSPRGAALHALDAPCENHSYLPTYLCAMSSALYSALGMQDLAAVRVRCVSSLSHSASSSTLLCAAAEPRIY